jgi:hypothetical protein
MARLNTRRLNLLAAVRSMAQARWRWDAHNKVLRWDVPTIEAVPDLAPAIELTRRYQPASGPMTAPTSYDSRSRSLPS